MTVRELIGILSAMDQDRIIVLSEDQEGNGYRPAYSISDNCAYKDREIGMQSLSEDDRRWGYTDEDIMVDGEPCVCLW